MTNPQTRAWRPEWPCPVGAILGVHRRGAGDPTYRVGRDGSHARALRTPEGPATLQVQPLDPQGVVVATAWGTGAAWALDVLPRMLGADDDVAGFEPRHEVIAAAWRRHPHWRLGATGLVLESLVPTVIEQKVTGQEAFAAFRRLVRRFGEPAPGPLDLMLQPAPATIRTIPSWEWLRLPIDGGRSRPLLAAVRVADALERAGGGALDDFDRKLRSIPGLGVWTSAEVRATALGDADAVSFGDYHVAKDIGWALTGEAVDDDALAELLAPYAPHRHRVQHLVETAQLGRPRRGPRMSPRTHLPGSSR
ncbi:DNA-3-methyladenine glycosylase 2 family protein [Nocardioides marmoriginsengisoli]|uniref:DNA-3-methyladenine glycosylase 2 family protein n=1 Tax=Nocardioides marmoriginsengisoli TaxID=661483 RepID=A0A3N0CNA9_9ACTN|nr:DNA-3-methyladenine glycosylase 2 family protein [Nocardioides marmoriginsengisoli]RNL64830.1 DNA-3-methyladenine glycosylase 2 family protein [Nocardioides marmoriginsengisoli]